MPTIKNSDVEIHYEVSGSGFPMFLIAPGGMDSAIAFWERATINPFHAFGDDYQLIAMDQRNAGASMGPFPANRPWDVLCGDQLAVADVLGLESFHIFGCCIGGPYALKLSHAAPERIRAVVLEQPLGIIASNRQSWIERCHRWAAGLAAERDDLDAAAGARFIDEMWRDDFVSSLRRDQISEIAAPICVLPGVDEIHPTEIGYEIARLAKRSILIEPWKQTLEDATRATERVRSFLVENTPATPSG